MAIHYEQATAARRPTFRTPKYGNLLADTIQGSIDQGSDGEWAAWLDNLSDRRKSKFRLGFRSRAAAARWLNAQLRDAGIK